MSFGFLEHREKWLQIVLGGPSPSEKAHKHGRFSRPYAEAHQFPQVFAQVWKTLGGDQIPYAGSCAEDRPANVT
jgi:hypothetical protein